MLRVEVQRVDVELELLVLHDAHTGHRVRLHERREVEATPIQLAPLPHGDALRDAAERDVEGLARAELEPRRG